MLVEVQSYKMSINDGGFTEGEIALIWEAYVTKAIAKSAAQRRRVSDYGLKELPWKDMLEVAEVTTDMLKILPANSINKTLIHYDLEIVEGKRDNKHNKAIEIDVPKIVCLTPYSIADEEIPKPSVGDAESVLTHIRNSFAHGNTYFFDNGNMMLEDKDQRGGITARMILHKSTLIDWISLIDPKHFFYDVNQMVTS